MAVTKCEFCGMYLPDEANVERHCRAVHVKTEDSKNDRIEA
jgi:hypothetical protein